MDPFDDVLDDEPPVVDPYEVLGIDKNATPNDIKSAYRKAALKNHPDKVPEEEKSAANEKFQSIAFAYAVLSDPVRRARYDATGSTAESIVDSDGFSWSDFYRDLYHDAVSAESIAKFSEQYKHSDEERGDVLAAYEKGQGDMDAVYESVMLSNVLDDDARFRGIIDEAIASKDVPSYPRYTKEPKKKREARVRAAKVEEGEAEEYAKELGVHDELFAKKGRGKKQKKGDDESGLAALIKRNQKDREGLLDDLAERWGAKEKKKKGKKRVVEEEPDEEAYEAAASRLKKPKEEPGRPKGKKAKR